MSLAPTFPLFSEDSRKVCPSICCTLKYYNSMLTVLSTFLASVGSKQNHLYNQIPHREVLRFLFRCLMNVPLILLQPRSAYHMNSALPYEIIDQVGPPVLIGFNDDERRSNLRACSLVCQSWVHRSRKNMFHYIRLYSVETWNKIKETLNWLPHHAKDVKILCIVSDSLLETFQPNEFLAELASVLPFIKNLTFSNVKIKLSTDNSTHLPFRFDTIEELSFDDVKLHTMTKFSSLIEAFPSLTHLTLDSIYLSRKIENSALPNFESLSYRTPVNLHRISVYHDRFWSPPTPVHEWIACSPMTAFVTHFTQYGPPFQYTSGEEQRISLSKCLQSRAPSLVCIRLPAYIFRTKSNLRECSDKHCIHALTRIL